MQGQTECKLNLRSRAEYMRICRDLVRILAQRAGIDARGVDDLVAASQEAVVNAITHGSPYGEDSSFDFVVTQVRDGLEVLVADSGDGFDINATVDEIVRVPDSTDSEHGRGLYIIATLTDRCLIERRGNRTLVIMWKSFLTPTGNQADLEIIHRRKDCCAIKRKMVTGCSKE